MQLRALGVATVLAVALTSCGNQDQEAAHAISDALVENSGGGALEFSRAEADCVADGWVDRIGVDRLRKYGILTEDLKGRTDMGTVRMSRDDAGSAADVVMGCADIMGNVRRAVDQAVGEQPDEVTSCIDDKLDEQFVHDFLVKRFMGDESGAQQDLTAALQECTSR